MLQAWHQWNLDQWLTHLEQRYVQEIQLGLIRIKTVAEKMGLTQPACTVLTVAGTNGKGSTVSALERIYHTAGYQVAAYSSPHLIHFNERIRVNLNQITDKALCQAFCFIENQRGSVPLTYFEMTTLAALWYFKQQPLDLIILEVGLGGRLDATNIIDADLSIITGIDYDHQHLLGSSLEAIGAEKAGILRAARPFIYADSNPPQSILKQAKKLAAPTYLFDIDYFFSEREESWDFIESHKRIRQLPKPQIHLKAASAALKATCLLQKKLPLTEACINKALPLISIPGRLQYQPGPINILYDVAHNPQAAGLLAQTLSKRKTGRVHAIFSALEDKDILGLILPLKDCVDHWYPAQLENKRAASEEHLLSVFEKAAIDVAFCYNSPLLAFQRALTQALSGDLIVVYGSFFTVGPVMAASPHILDQMEML